jgi:hypothetical protein
MHVIPPIIGLGVSTSAGAVRHERHLFLQRQKAHGKVIRSNLYASLGIIPSPVTSRTMRAKERGVGVSASGKAKRSNLINAGVGHPRLNAYGSMSNDDFESPQAEYTTLHGSHS